MSSRVLFCGVWYTFGGFENGLEGHLPDHGSDIHRDLVPLDWLIAMVGLSFALVP